jgi:cytochrome c oxidase assembly protein subunit 15
VLTDLNPWVVSLHLMLSMVMIALAVWLVRLVFEGGPLTIPLVGPGLRRLTGAVLGVAFVVLYAGTVVTGAGPHAGHLEATDLEGDRVELVRNGLDAQAVSHVHAALVYLLVALTVAALVVAVRTGAPEGVRRAAAALLAVEVAQGAVGFAQYFQDLPVLLVGIHLLGASLLAAAAAWLVVSTRAAAHPHSSTAREDLRQPSSGSTATATKSSAR